ncbi:MAG: 4'-phosphopantetheinyl transferase superfamily protein [Planctomycetes bacterium]|nr:4'-phosphopantetheinyl transferase superfamily protein [Planctomycetota bacterium]
MITIMLRPIDSGTAKEGKAAAREICEQMGLAVWPRESRVSRSGTAGLGAAAVAERGSVGVDVERIDAGVVDESLLDVVLHPAEAATMPRDHVEQRFFSLWTRKEAVLKALGTGLWVSPRSIAVGWGGEDWLRVEAPGGGVCAVRSWDAPEGFAGAVAFMPREGGLDGPDPQALGSIRIVILAKVMRRNCMNIVGGV